MSYILEPLRKVNWIGWSVAVVELRKPVERKRVTRAGDEWRHAPKAARGVWSAAGKLTQSPPARYSIQNIIYIK